MRRSHMIGMMLWRGGLLLAGAWAAFETARWLLKWFAVPPELEIGLGLGLSGLALVLLSLILERVRDSRAEKDLQP